MDAIHHFNAMGMAKGAEALFGIQLPIIERGTLASSARDTDAAELLEAVQAFKPNCGWVQFRDALSIYVEPPELTRSDLLEAQFASAQSSLHIRYLGNGRYRLTTQTALLGEHDAQSACVERGYYTPNGLLVRYLHWYWDVDSKGDWKPIAQQFLGFKQPEELQGGD